MADWLILYKQGLKNLLRSMRDEIGSVYGGVKSKFLTRVSSLKSVDSLEPCECLLIPGVTWHRPGGPESSQQPSNDKQIVTHVNHFQ